MNGTEQKERRTAIIELSQRIDKLAEAFDVELQEIEARINNHIGGVANRLDEQHHAAVIKQGEEALGLLSYLHRTENDQRHYVDDADRLLAARQMHFEGMKFWARFRWMFTGRVL